MAAVRSPKTLEPMRRVETLCKQEKANRIVAEAIARAKARGERNIPRVLNLDELPAATGLSSPELGATATAGTAGGKRKGGGGGAKKKSSSSIGGKAGGGAGEKKGKAKSGSGLVGTGGAGGTGGVGGSKSKSKAKTK